MPRLPLDRLVNEFAETVLAQRDALERRDVRTGNKHARRRFKVFDMLRARGDAGREALSALFHHPEAEVSSMAACYLLRYKTEEALAVLREIAERPDLLGFEAEQCMKRWEEGTSELDPE